MRHIEFETKGQRPGNNRKWQRTFIVNIALLAAGTTMSISGLILQCFYHLRGKPDESMVFMLDRAQWNIVHIWTALFFILVTIYHVCIHEKWYGNALKKHPLAQHRPVIVLTVVTFLVVLSGLIPLFILYCNGSPAMRFAIIEIHDKIAVLFLIVVFRHTIKRFKWYVNIMRSKFRKRIVQ